MAVNVNVGGNTGPLERDVRAAINRINKSGGLKVRMDDKGVTQPLGNMKRSADEFTKSLEASNARVLAFGASVGIINAVTDAFKGLVNATIQVQKNLTDINVVMGLSNQQLDKFGTGLFKVAAETGAGFQEASKAATEFARQGLTVNETLKRTKDALILTRLTGMDAADSVKSLTAAMNTFGHQVDNSTQLVSKFAAVDVKFAVSAKDFAEAIARAGQSAKSAGVDLDSFVGMVTAVQEKTARGGAVIGNAFKTIFTRTQRPQTLKAMENLGIQVRTLNGEVLAADKILFNLSKRWDTLTTSQKANIGQTTAGMFQINLLKAALEDMGQANSRWTEAMGISSRATDESNKKNEQLRATMSALATETGVAVQQLAQTIGDLALAPGINKVLESLKGITEWLNNTLGGGEEEGNKFAMGLVAGMGNYLSGPGLVMFAAVLGKLFVNAVKYGAQSLSSLLNINKAASQRKSIEQAVLAVLTQNSKIQKEMLSTKLTQEKKEAIILGLIKQQTVEAAKLQSISRTMVGPLVRAGVGPNLKMKARGYVPNFANPEKEAAREAGYAPGGVREKNIPGAGRVVYNSAETVRNFAGLSQPAIMPPEGSRAGANYRQAFSGAHGFDPYAAGGYVPNFNPAAVWTTGKTNKWHDKGGKNPYKSVYDKRKGLTNNSASYLDLNKLLGEPFMRTMGVLTGQGAQSPRLVNYTQTLASVPELRNRLIQGFGGNPKQKAAADDAAKNIRVRAGLMTRGVYPVDKNDANQLAGASWPSTIRGSQGMKGAAKELSMTVRNKIFGRHSSEVADQTGQALNHLLSEPAWQGYMLEASVKGAMGRGIDVGAESQRAFDIDGGSEGLRKFMGLPNLRAIELKNSEGAGKGVSGGVANKVMNRIFQKNRQGVLIADFAKQRGLIPSAAGPGAPKGIGKAAFGFVPNFAQDGLTESISREETAMRGRGLPVSAVRIGQSDKLQTKGNPTGLGVTNTVDEPNGLRDVLSAAGLVPNYSVMGVGGAFKNASMAGQHYSKVHKDLERKLKAYAQKVASGTYTQANLTAYMKKVEKDYKIQSSTMVKLNAAMNKEVATRRAAGGGGGGGGGLRGRFGSIGGFFAGKRSGAQGGGAMGALGRFQGGHGKAGKFGSGLVGMPGMMGGMALSMGAGVASEYFDPEGTSETAQGASGLMSGAATGAMMGSMLGPLGALAGGVLGAGLGWISGSKKATEAIEKLSTAAKESAVAMHKTALASALSDEKLGEVFNAYSDEGKQVLKYSGLEGASNEKVMDHIINKGSGSKKLMAEFFDNNQTKMFKRTVFDKDTKKSKEKEFSGEEIAAELRSGKIKGKEYEGLVTQMREYRDNLKEQQKNSIKAMQQRINIQRVIIKSETRFLRSKHLADMKHQRTQQILTSSMQLYAKTFNKAQLHELSYNKKLNTSRKKLNDGLEAASQGYKKGVLQFIQNDGGSGLSQKFRDAINSSGPAKADISKILGADSSRFFKDIKAGNADDAIAGLDPEKLRKVIELLNQKDLLDETIREKLDVEGEKRDQNILKIKQANSLAENQINFEAGVNRELAIRETIMKNIELSNKRSLNLQSQALQITKYVSNVAGLREDISLASVGGGTAAEKFQVDQRKRKRDLADSLLGNSNSRTETLLSKLMGNKNLTDLGPGKMSVLRDEMSDMSASEGAAHLKNTVWKIIENKRKGGDSKGYNRAEFIDHRAVTAKSGGPTPKQIADIKGRTGMHPKDIVSLWDRSEKERVAAIESNLAAKVAVSKQGLAGEGTTRLGKDTGTDTEHARRALWRMQERVVTGAKEWESVHNPKGLELRAPGKDDKAKWQGSTTEGKIWGEDGELNVGGIIKSGDKVWKEKYQEKYFKILGLDEEGHVQIEQIVEKTAAITEKTNEVLKKNMIFKWEIAKKEKAHNDLIYSKTRELFLEGKGLSAHTSIESAVKALKVQTAADDRISEYFQRLHAGLESDDFLKEYGPKSLFESSGGLERLKDEQSRADFNDWTRSDRGKDDSLALHGLTRTLSVRGGSDPRQTLAGLGGFQTGLFDSGNDKINKINAAAVPKELVEARSKMLKKMREHGVDSAKPGRWEKLDDNQRKEILDLGEAYEKQLSAFAKTNENLVRYAKVGKVHDGFNHQARKTIVSQSLSEEGMAKDLRDTSLTNLDGSSSGDRATQLALGEGHIKDRKTQVNEDAENVEKATEALEKHGSAIARATNQSTVRFAAERRMYDLEAKSIDEITGKHEIKNDTLREEYLLKEKLEQIKYDFVYGADAFSNGMNVAFRDSFEKSARFKHELGKAIPEAFSRSMSDAMMKLIREGGDFGDAMMDVGISFLNTINQKFMENWMDKFMGSFYKGADIPDETLKAADANLQLDSLKKSALEASGGLDDFNGALDRINLKLGSQGLDAKTTTSESSSSGGFFKGMWDGFKNAVGFNKGGQIPTMLTSGEYVMRKSAVDKMGTAGMDALNKGVVPGRHKGGPAPGSNEAWSAAFGADWDMRASGKQNSHVAKYYKRLAEKKKEPTIADIFSKPINRRKSRISSDYAAEGTSLAEIFGFPSRKKKEPTLADIFSSPLPQKANEPPSFYGGKRGAAGKLPKRFQEKLKRLKAGSPNLEDLFKLGVPFDRKNAGGAMMGSLGMAGMSYLMGRKADKDARKEAEYQERPDDYFQKNPAYKKYKMSTAFMQRDRRVQEDVSKHREKKEEELQAWIQKKNRQQALGRAVVGAVGNFAMSKLGDSLNSKTGWGSKETGKFDSDGNAIRQSAFGRFDDSLGYKKMGYKMESWGLNKQQARLNRQQSSFGQSDLSGDDYQAKWDQYYSNEDLLNSNQGRLAELSTLQGNAPRSTWQKTGSWASGGGYKNAGGKISGPAGIDVIPAMLTEGEYVINANAAKKIGMPTLERINAGKFNEGGVVGDKTGETPSSSPSSNTNNISITVNVKGDSEGTSEGKGEEKDNKNEMMDKLSQRIKQQVVTVIREENRPGGLLRS